MSTLALQLEELFMFQKFKQTVVNLIFDTMDLYYGMKLMRDLKFELLIHLKKNYPCISLSNSSGAPAAQRAAKRSPIVITGKERKPMKDFLMVIMTSGIARGRVRTTTTTTESRNMVAILQKIG